MPWKEQTMEQQRKEFVHRVERGEISKSALCREFGISRPTGDKWIGRYQRGETMENQSKAPFHSPNRTAATTEEKIIALRNKHPALGAKKIKKILENKGEAAPAYSTINAILHRNGLITKEASLAATPCIRFEKARPNEMWQADFKGHFGMKNGNRCHPLTIVDDHSRYCVCLDAKENERYPETRASFERVFERYGLPETILCDNGNPWGTAQSVGYSRFEVWLMDLGILTRHGRIMHPQTQGKDERFNGTLLRELIRYRAYEDYIHAQSDFDEWRCFYNEERPHHALNLGVPVDRYQESTRKLPRRIDEWVYEPDTEMKKVKNSGYLTLRGQGYFLSEAFGGKMVGLIENMHEHGEFLVLYRQFCVAKLNVDDRVVLARKAFFCNHVFRENV